MGLDLGTKTIGTATCDAGWRFATNGKTIVRGKWGKDREKIAALIAERTVKGLVLGLPLNMDGSAGPRAQASRAFARSHAHVQIGHPDVAIFGLLIPHVYHVIAGPDAIGFAQADTFANARHRRKAKALLALVSLVLDFDLNHGTCPWSEDRDRRQY